MSSGSSNTGTKKKQKNTATSATAISPVSTRTATRVVRTTRVVNPYQGQRKWNDGKNGAGSIGGMMVMFLKFGILGIVLSISFVLPEYLAYELRTESNNAIWVWDNVLSSIGQVKLEQACQDWQQQQQASLSSSSSSSSSKNKKKMDDVQWFAWPPKDNYSYRNSMERVLTELMNEMHDASKEAYQIEYWMRLKWHHTVAHADLDESHLKKVEKEWNPPTSSTNEMATKTTSKTSTTMIDVPDQKHPIWGHVLYLYQGQEANGPTVVFPNAMGNAGRLYQNVTLANGTENPDAIFQDLEFLIVPNVPGRLLRFQGNLVHAVPRPALLWLYPQSLYQMEYPHRPKDTYGRSVLLFNLWPANHNTPKNKDNQSKNEDDDDIDSTTSNKDNVYEWYENKDEWDQANILNVAEESWLHRWITKTQSFQLPLMGSNSLRRGTNEPTLQLQAPVGLVEWALEPSTNNVNANNIHQNIAVADLEHSSVSSRLPKRVYLRKLYHPYGCTIEWLLSKFWIFLVSKQSFETVI